MASTELLLWRAYDPDLPHTKAPGYDPLGGEGARFSPGRWHTEGEGKRLVYASEHPALAFCELFAHNPLLARVALVKFWVRTPGLDTFGREALEGGLARTQALGDRWYREGAYPVLKVPSALLPLAWNYVVKPKEVELRLLERHVFKVDERLRCT